jgi:hypothetical protein
MIARDRGEPAPSLAVILLEIVANDDAPCLEDGKILNPIRA